jgi:hypothetical protein
VSRRRRWLIGTFVVVTALVIALRLALPAIATHIANERLRAMGEYSGHVDDVEIALIRGAYVLRGLRIVKPAAHTDTPFLDVDRVDVSLQWNALFHARVVGELALWHPVVNFVQGHGESDSQLGTGVNWPAEVRRLFPFDFNRVLVDDGTITFRAPGIQAEESLTMREVHLLVRNLANVEPKDRRTFADLDLTGFVMGTAPVTLTGRIDPNADAPTFDIDLTLKQAQLVEVNPWLRRFLNVDAQRGMFSMYTELAAEDGAVRGYVKPFLEDPQFLDLKDPEKGIFHKAWEALVQLAAKLFEARPEDQVATKIPVSGRLDAPHADVLATIVNLLRNAFVGAFTRSLEGSVTLRDSYDEAQPHVDVAPSSARNSAP